MGKGTKLYGKRIGAFFLAILVAFTTVIMPMQPQAVYAAEYAKLGASAGFVSNFTFTTGINSSAGNAVFADTGAVVNGSSRTPSAEGNTIKIPNGFRYYDGNVYDIYIRIKFNSYTATSWKYERVDTSYIILQYGSERDMDFSIWVQKGEYKISDINLIAGSCYTAKTEGARPWSDDGKIYTNIPTSQLAYDSTKNVWSPKVADYDKPNYFILGHGKNPDGSINGGYCGSGGAEMVLGYLVKTATFKIATTGVASSLEYSSKLIAVDKQIVAPKLTAEQHDIGYWITDKNVTLTDGTTKTAGTHLTTAEMNKIVVSDNVTCSAYLIPHNWTTTTEGNTTSMKCSNEVCTVSPNPSITLSAEDADYRWDVYNEAANIKLTGNVAAYTKYGLSGVAPSVTEVRYYSDSEYTNDVTAEAHKSLETGEAPENIGIYYVKLSLSNGQELKTSFNISKRGNYNSESLNNKQDTDTEKPIKPVSGDYGVDGNDIACADLIVHLNDAADKVTLYKIADFKWDSANNTYDNLEWVDEVKTWNTDFGKIDPLYSSPEAMMKATTDKWDDYYRAMFDTEDASSTNITTLADESKRLKPVKGCVNRVADPSEGAESITTFKNLPFGQYAVLGTDSESKKYKVSVVNVVPYHTGGVDSWVAYYTYEVYLKDSEIDIDKTLNNLNGDAVAIGDTVEFEIKSSIPDYKETDGRDFSSYMLWIEDAMSPSFTMVDDSLKIYGYNGDGDELDITELDYYTIEKSTRVNAESKLTDNILTIKFKVDKLNEYKTSHSGKGIRTIKIVYNAVANTTMRIGSEYNYNTATIKYEKSSDGTVEGSKTDTVRAYTYGLNVVKINGSDTENGKKPLAGAEFSLYEETDCFVDNVWMGSMELENSPELNNYTYTLGDTEEETAANKSEAIAAARVAATNRFYKEKLAIYNAVVTEEKRITEENLEEFKAIYNKYAPLESDEEGTVTYSDIFKNSADNDTYYIYEESFDNETYTAEKYPDGVTLDNGIHITIPEDGTAVKVIRIFKKYIFTDAENKGKAVFVSKDSLEGNNIQGLDANNYILIETKAPAGFNRLAENMYFSIRMLSEEEANTQFSGSYAGFKKSDGTFNTTGIQQIEVMNYKGLVLPSTGGMGTLIFIISGMMLMCGVIIFMLTRKKVNDIF